MLYRVLADLTVLVHLAFVGFVLFGGLFALRWRRAMWLHLPAAVWGAGIALGGWICPLTYLENDLRRASGAAGYSESFVERYLLPVLYPGQLTRTVQVLLGVIVILLNLAIYYAVWRRHRRSRAI